jgi:predicted small lipoprotein YifL
VTGVGRRMVRRKLLILGAALALLVGCGKKGPPYLPEQEGKPPVPTMEQLPDQQDENRGVFPGSE